MNHQSHTSHTSELNPLLKKAALDELTEAQIEKFEAYLQLILRWSSQMNLTAIRDPGGIIRRHFLECIACAQNLPDGITTLLDLGSGAGFPGVPIALCRRDLVVTLAESQNKKAAFLREVGRKLELDIKVVANRAESLETQFNCVTLRAVDRMSSAIKTATSLLAPEGWLVVMTSHRIEEDVKAAAGVGIAWGEPLRLFGSDARSVLFGLNAVPRGTARR